MEVFGNTDDGADVHRKGISGGGLSANIISWGAVIQDLRLEGHRPPLVLGCEKFADYPEKSPYFGAIAGRFANRIASGRFSIDEEEFQADQNFLGKHTLHGGANGTGKRNWKIADTGEDFVTLTVIDAAGEMGFPGNLEISCTYRLLPPGRLVVEFEATTDAPTPCNLAHHSYFNLNDGGQSDVLDHRLQIAAAAYLPVDDELIPTGVVKPVEGTDFDFRLARPIRYDSGGEQQLYDHNFCLSAQRGALRRAVWAQGNASGVEMEVWTTEPGVQFYAGGGIAEMDGGLEGRAYKAHSGFCLEAQTWPDGPNRPYFPNCILRPGETYHQVTEYRFKLPTGL
ncbi:MAG: aldose epimerase family protein [Rhizobiaceae bacterium]